MRVPLRRFLAIFVAGLFAALPLAGTVLIFAWGARFLLSWLGPGSAFGRTLARLGVQVSGSELAGYAIGVAIVSAGIFALGLLVETGMQRGLQAAIGAVVQRIPIVRSVYDTLERFVQMLSRRDASGLATMSPVWCHFGGPGGAAVLGLMPSPEAVPVGGRLFHAVLLPTAPVPLGGALIYVPSDWVTPADVGIEALTSIYVSMGVTSKKYLETVRAVETARTA